MIHLRAVTDTAAFHALWGWVRDGLMAVRKKARAHWLPEDVYAALKQGRAFLWLLCDTSDELGFMVVQIEEDSDGRCLFIWALWGAPGDLIPHKANIYEEVEKLARSVHARRIRFEGRDGWMGHRWATAVRRVYEREV